MKRLNGMCLNCSQLNNGCNGTTIQCFCGCLYRDKKPRINSNRCKKPLFTYDLYDDLTHDPTTGAEYMQVIITQWSDTTEKAHEIAHKRFYITSNDLHCIRGYNGRGYSLSISEYLWNYGANNDDRLKDLFKLPDNSRVNIEYAKSEFYTVNGKTYKFI